MKSGRPPLVPTSRSAQLPAPHRALCSRFPRSRVSPSPRCSARARRQKEGSRLAEEGGRFAGKARLQRNRGVCVITSKTWRAWRPAERPVDERTPPFRTSQLFGSGRFCLRIGWRANHIGKQSTKYRRSGRPPVTAIVEIQAGGRLVPSRCLLPVTVKSPQASS